MNLTNLKIDRTQIEVANVSVAHLVVHNPVSDSAEYGSLSNDVAHLMRILFRVISCHMSDQAPSVRLPSNCTRLST